MTGAIQSAESPDAVIAALFQFITDEVVATTMALGALRTLAQMVIVEAEAGIAPEHSLLVGNNVPDVGWILRFDNLDAARTHAERVGPGGSASRRLTQQLIVTVDTAWEEEFRGRLAEARGLENRREVKADFFRDLRWLRNDIVHHRGLASAGNAARSTVFNRRFSAGDPVYLDDIDLFRFTHLVPWAALDGTREGK